jgi:hypothetical protein
LEGPRLAGVGEVGSLDGATSIGGPSTGPMLASSSSSSSGWWCGWSGGVVTGASCPDAGFGMKPACVRGALQNDRPDTERL